MTALNRTIETCRILYNRLQAVPEVDARVGYSYQIVFVTARKPDRGREVSLSLAFGLATDSQLIVRGYFIDKASGFDRSAIAEKIVMVLRSHDSLAVSSAKVSRSFLNRPLA